MQIIVRGLPSSYEAEHLARLFFPGAALNAGGATAKVDTVYARVSGNSLAAGLRQGGVCHVWRGKRDTALPAKTDVCRALYQLLRHATGLRPPWGMLTGVRPLSLYRRTLEAGGEAAVEQKLVDLYDVSGEKLALLRGISARQAPVLAASTPRSYSLYVSVPFCPSRCAYCSFVSRTIEREGHLVGPYLEALEKELAATSGMAKTLGLRLETVYIGGGTPTALGEADFARLLESIARHFDTAAAREYTIEAGRPDCTTPAKLRLMKAAGATRISINPQTMQDAVLDAIGRRHTAGDILRCYSEARAAGHESINMDLIAGLPGDSEAGFAATLGAILALEPENITLHTLTRKRASDIVIEGRREASLPGAMLDHAYPRLTQAGYAPYYLYRQKSTVANLENTGWAKPGQDGLYNIYIMEEAHTILAVGAGAATKLVGAGPEGTRRIQRLYNHKYPAEYIARFEELAARKKGVEAFYAGNLDTQTAR